MARRQVDVEVSIVSTNNRDLLRNCLQSIPGACDGLLWHVIVVENASTDGSAEMVRDEFPWVELIENGDRLGFSANHNQVLRRALENGARYALVLNEDTVLDPSSIRELVEFSDVQPGVGAVGPVIVGGDGLVQRSLFTFPTLTTEAVACLRPGRPPRPPKDDGWLNGSCVLIRADALRQIGLLDERFFIFFEDTDIGLRLRQAGWTSALCSPSRIVHLGHQTVSQPAYGDRMERQMLRSRYLYFRKHYGTTRARALAVVVRAALGLRAGKALASSALLRDSETRALAQVLWALAKYDPRLSLSHEVAAIPEAP